MELLDKVNTKTYGIPAPQKVLTNIGKGLFIIVTGHNLRGNYIDLLLSNNLSGKFAQNQAGHSKWDTTYNAYAQNNSDMVENAMTKINNIFSEKTENNLRIKENPPNKKNNPIP